LATRYLQSIRAFNRNVRLYLAAQLFVGLSYFGIFSVLFNLYLLRLGYGTQAIGTINAGMLLGYALFSPFAGSLGNRLGMHRVIWIGLAITMVGFLALPMAGALRGLFRSAWLVAAGGLAWLGMAGVLVNGDVLLYAEAGREGSGHAFSIFLALWGITSFAGSIAAGWLPTLISMLVRIPAADPSTYAYSLLLSGVLLVPGLVCLVLIRPSVQAGTAVTEKATGKAPYAIMLLLSLVQMLQGTGEGAVRAFLNVYLAEGLHISTSGIGTLMAVAQLLPVPVALVAPLILSRWGNQRVFVWSSLAVAVCLLPLALIPRWTAAGFGYTGIMSMAWLWRTPSIRHRMGLVAPGWRPLVNGMLNMALGVSWSAVTLAGGYAIAAWGYRTFFLGAAALTAAGALIFRYRFPPDTSILAAPPVPR
jgi:MFS family permease